MKGFSNTFELKLIYIISIDSEKHKGMLKIGDATVHTNSPIDKLPPNCAELNRAAKERIKKYTKTANIEYRLEHTELAQKSFLKNNVVTLSAFRDYAVHNVLIKSGFRKQKSGENYGNEWFKINLPTAIEAISAVKNGQTMLKNIDLPDKDDYAPINFRPEQKAAIKLTKDTFKKKDKMLWNAKMRFGKTLSTLQIIKELDFRKTIILTHRPVVDKGWYDDFKKIFYNDLSEIAYGSKVTNTTVKDLDDSGKKYVYFASVQDLRGSEKVGGKYNKNDDVFKNNWDFVVVDEAHEGTTTSLGEQVIQKIVKENNGYTTKFLALSGTPFNIVSEYEQEQVYTWDYVMEQQAKHDWDIDNFGDSNPYDELPKMNIFTYSLGEIINSSKYQLDDKAFNFKEFFRTWTGDILSDFKHIPSDQKVGDFVHEKDVQSFLNLITKDSDNNNYPYTNEEFRKLFKHTLWMVPGVREAKALSTLMGKHPVFGSGQFNVINVAGDGDEEGASEEALSKVENGIKKANLTDTYTITLSCGKLTTGVTIREWTAVMMLSGSYSTAASNYLQTIFRVQSPANIDGKIKENCYVFDFAPDRTLKMVADAVSLSAKAGKTRSGDKDNMKKFLNYCPVISFDGTEMKTYNVEGLLQQLKRAYADRAVRNGFDDTSIYNDIELSKLTEDDLVKFEELSKIISSSKNSHKTERITVNDQGLTDEQYEEFEKIKKKKKSKKDLTDEEKERLVKLKEIKDNRLKAISNLRAVSIRIPLLIYGIDIDFNEDISPNELIDKIDPISWVEFMPKDFTKDMFKDFIKYYDEDIFVSAGRKIRSIVKYADTLNPTERIVEITKLFDSFKNPDKETVLTPWRVVNMHISETFGGYSFYNSAFDKKIDSPEIRNNDKIKDNIFNHNSKIIEINSKTGLYPLYCAYSIFRNICEDIEHTDIHEQVKLWDEIIDKNIYSICKTPMAKQITKRTLYGYRKARTNTHCFDDLVNQMQNKQQQLVDKICNKKTWSKEVGIMKFNACVGNPPYQGMNHQQIYPDFYLTAQLLADNVSLIFPVGWQQPKNGNNLRKLNNEKVKNDKQIVFIDNKQNVFPGISGAEWVNIILWKKGFDNQLNGQQRILTNGDDEEVLSLKVKESSDDKPLRIKELSQIVCSHSNFKSIKDITSASKPYGLRTDFIGNPEKYGFQNVYSIRRKDTDIKIYSGNNVVAYLDEDFNFPKKSKAFQRFKVFVPYAWGNMNESAGLGGAFSDILIAAPNEAATETFLESGSFETKIEAQKHAKYLMTKFCRALLYLNKFSQHSTTSWGAIPIQDYSEYWWDSSIEEINKQLFIKYNIPKNIECFVNKNIQTKSEINIINFN